MNRCLFRFLSCFLIATTARGSGRTIPLVHRIHSAAERRGFKAINDGRLYFNAYPRDYIALNVSIGTPPQQFTLAVECGQLHSWVLGTDFSLLQDGQPAFNSTASSTSRMGGRFQGATGNLQVYGNTYTDVFRIGADITIDSQQFGDVDEVEGPEGGVSYGNPQLSGAVGLLWHTQEADQPLLLNIFDALNVTKRVLTIRLGPSKPPSQGVPDAALTFGGLDTAHCSASVHSIFWDNYPNIAVSRFVSGSISSDGEQWTFIDTGYPLIAFEFELYRAVYQQINPDYDWDLGLLTTPCSTTANLPSWVFTIGLKDPSVPPSNYVLDLDIDGGKTCAVALELKDDGDFENFVLGNPFVRAFCIVYDVDDQRIGFAEVLVN